MDFRVDLPQSSEITNLCMAVGNPTRIIEVCGCGRDYRNSRNSVGMQCLHFPPQMGGMGGSIPPISERKNSVPPIWGGRPKLRNRSFLKVFCVFKCGNRSKTLKNVIFRRRLRRAVKKRGIISTFRSFWSILEISIPPILSQMGGLIPPILKQKNKHCSQPF